MFLLHLRLTIKQCMPELIARLDALPDSRSQYHFTTGELAMAAICMFVLKRGSRNAMNQTSAKESFARNFILLFGFDFPQLDAVETYFRLLDPQHLEDIKMAILQILFKRKTLHKFRLLGLYHIVAIDGVHIHTFNHQPFDNCPHKTKGGQTKWEVNAVEAKLVYSCGFALSIASEFMLNNDGDKKQDCEQKAAMRLCKKIKKMFPALPICIAADGLYTSEKIFKLCKTYNWKFLITLKDDCLESVWKEIRVERRLQWKNRLCEQFVQEYKWISKNWQFVKNIPYHKNISLNFIELVTLTHNKKKKSEVKKKFAYVTNLDVTKSNANEIIEGARLRWNIENQGFNEQKNRGYALKHKYSRTSFWAIQNYYQCMQLAHMIAQLSVKTVEMKRLKGKLTEKFMWEQMVSFVSDGMLLEQEVTICLQRTSQFRY